MGSSRTINTMKNIFWGYVGNIVTIILQFVSRTVFIYTIGMTYLGVSGLFANILGMLSLTELGIGTAINFNLYKPVSEGNKEKIKSLMRLYRKAYNIIALLITVIGLLILPFLKYLIKDANGLTINELSIYYLIYLFNTVTSYLISYKYGLLYAEQKGYIITNLNTIFNLVILIGQIIVLYVFNDFLLYLLIQCLLQVLQKILTSMYINKHYSFLSDKNAKPLNKNELVKIKNDVVALIIHKIGEVSVYQTDNIIISVFINVTAVAKISNYNLIITAISGFITIIMNSVTSSLGNLIAAEDKEKQIEVFYIFNFVSFWLYGFTSVCFYVLFEPFILLWIGNKALVDEFTLVLLILNHYLTGQRIAINNLKTAGGIFTQDKYISLLQGVINLILSVALVRVLGLPGIYIGTVLSGLFVNIIRPAIVYNAMFNMKASQYYKKFFEYILITVVGAFSTKFIISKLFIELNWINFIMMSIMCFILINIFYFIFYFNSKEMCELKKRIKIILHFSKN